MEKDVFEFIKAALRNPLAVSTVFPTSAALANILLDEIGLPTADDPPFNLIEVGAGTGAITKQIVIRLRPCDSYLGIELDPQMTRFLRTNFPTLKFESGYAHEISRWVGDGQSDAVIATLPWSMLTAETQAQTLEAIHRALHPNGVFITYLCINALLYLQAHRFLELLERQFDHVEQKKVEWRNFPPAIIYRALKTESRSPLRAGKERSRSRRSRNLN